MLPVRELRSMLTRSGFKKSHLILFILATMCAAAGICLHPGCLKHFTLFNIKLVVVLGLILSSRIYSFQFAQQCVIYIGIIPCFPFYIIVAYASMVRNLPAAAADPLLIGVYDKLRIACIITSVLIWLKIIFYSWISFKLVLAGIGSVVFLSGSMFILCCI